MVERCKILINCRLMFVDFARHLRKVGRNFPLVIVEYIKVIGTILARRYCLVFMPNTFCALVFKFYIRKSHCRYRNMFFFLF